jgi:tape measure domain-containing protein
MMVSLTSLSASELVNSGQFDTVNAAQETATKNAEELYKWVTKLSIVSPFQKQDILNIMQMGMGFGISTDNVKVLTQATVDWASASGKSSAEMESVMRAIGQISGASVVAKEDLNQLRDAGLPAAAILAKMRGQTQGQFLQDVTDGAVKGTDAIRILTEYLQTQYTGAAEKAGGTLDGLVSSLRDIKSERLSQVFTPITDNLVKPILEMGVALAQSETAAQFFDELGARINAFGTLVMGVFYNATQLFNQFFGLIPEEVKTFAATFAQVGVAIAGVSLALTAVGIAFSVFGAVVGLVLSPRS